MGIKDVSERPLFVFGTLRRGECNHHLLAGRYDRHLPAVLHGFTRSEPLMIVRAPRDRVEGELYFLSPAQADQTLRDCDDLEGIPEGSLAGPEYRRIEVTVETPEGSFAAWAYVHPATEVLLREDDQGGAS